MTMHVYIFFAKYNPRLEERFVQENSDTTQTQIKFNYILMRGCVA